MIIETIYIYVLLHSSHFVTELILKRTHSFINNSIIKQLKLLIKEIKFKILELLTVIKIQPSILYYFHNIIYFVEIS